MAAFIYNRETLLAVRKALKEEALSESRIRTEIVTPVVVRKKEMIHSASPPKNRTASAGAGAKKPANVWERLREERERAALETELPVDEDATKELKQQVSTFSDDDRARLAQLRQHMRSRTMPAPRLRHADRSELSPERSEGRRRGDAEVEGRPRKRLTPFSITDNTPRRVRDDEQPADQVTTPDGQKPKPASDAPPTVGAKTPQRTGWAARVSGSGSNHAQKEIEPLPNVDLEKEVSSLVDESANTVSNDSSSNLGPINVRGSNSTILNPGAKAFFPTSMYAGAPLKRVAPAAPGQAPAPFDPKEGGRRVPANKKALLDMHPDQKAAAPAEDAAKTDAKKKKKTKTAKKKEEDKPKVPSDVQAAVDALLPPHSAERVHKIAVERATPIRQEPVDPSENYTTMMVSGVLKTFKVPKVPEHIIEEAKEKLGIEIHQPGFVPSTVVTHYMKFAPQHGALTRVLNEAERNALIERNAMKLNEARPHLHHVLNEGLEEMEANIDSIVDNELSSRKPFAKLSEEEQKAARTDYKMKRLRVLRLGLVQRIASELRLSLNDVITALNEVFNERQEKKRQLAAERKKLATMLRKGVTEDQAKQRVRQRQRQLRIGMYTIGYKVWEKVKDLKDPHFRVQYHVRTPVPEQACSKRSWDGLIRQWRQRLHQYDQFAEEVLTPEDRMRAKLCDTTSEHPTEILNNVDDDDEELDNVSAISDDGEEHAADDVALGAEEMAVLDAQDAAERQEAKRNGKGAAEIPTPNQVLAN